MIHDIDLPEEIVECLETYCEGRCPEFAQTLLEELAVHSQRTEDVEQRCVCARLLRRWHSVDTKRRDLPKLHAVPSPPDLTLVSNQPVNQNGSSTHARNRPTPSALQKWRSTGSHTPTVRSLVKG